MVNNHFTDFSIYTNFNFHQTSPADTGDVYTFIPVPSLNEYYPPFSNGFA